MKIKDAIDWIDIARMGYICDPNDCGLEKGGDTCRAFHCDEIHDALVMAMDTLEMADRLEHADADVYNKCCEVCTLLTICKERGEVCAEASAWEDGYNQALTDIRGDAE